MRKLRLAALVLSTLAATQTSSTLAGESPTPPPVTVGRGSHVLLNGRFAPGEWADATRLALDADHEILVKRDDRWLYIAVRSLGAPHTGLDLYLADGHGTRRRLHVSAALGDSVLADGSWSDMRWGENDLWSANSIGSIVEEGKTRFLAPQGFELQINLALMDHPALRCLLHLKRPEKLLPENAQLERTESWLKLKLDGAAAHEKETAPTMAAVSWMAGHWAGETTDGTRMEETWLGPGGGMMLGVHRDVSPSDDVFFEYLRIQESQEGLVYRASPGGKGTTAFLAISVDEGRVVFANPDHDFPQRIVYWLADDGMHARIEGTVDGTERSTEWVWRRQEYPANAER